MVKNFFLFFILFICMQLQAQHFITSKNDAGNFSLQSVTIYADANDDWLVQKAATFLQQDIELVTGARPLITNVLPAANKKVIIIGTANSTAIKRLVKSNSVKIDSIKDKWEAYQIQVVNENTLVITGSDKRGTAYGIFELSKQIGVSPWYWWADVPVRKNKNLFVKNGTYYYPSPAVKYRGIFLNDEAPALSGWTKEKFGGFNHLFYEKVFELLLRLKANYLWPAMWGSTFNDDDTLNPVLANKYGIVMGTSHHEPMMCAHDEWRRYGAGKWNYDSNSERLNAFWKKGIERMNGHESIVTIGMRGDGDEPMSEESNITLLEKIVASQRNIIENVTGKKVDDVPQMWALYKEVQDYYDKGMRVPDDVTLLLCDDNWGNIRKLPKLTDVPRKGGYGIYYHFDYVGDPRNYKWLNTNNNARIWEQMHLAYEYGARQAWIVNVGDLKPMEFPISFFLDYAWNANTWNIDSMTSYAPKWAAQQFGGKFANDIAYLLTKYTQYNARRKPELLSADTYNIDEWDTVVKEYNAIVKKSDSIYALLPNEYKDAYYQLVYFPIIACANLNEMYYAQAQNQHYATIPRKKEANEYADKVEQLFNKDAAITKYYNDTLANGKWRHMMDQTHIGYTGWQQPETNVMPKTIRLENIENGIVENNLPAISYHSMEAENYSKAINTNGIEWKVISGIGRTAGGVTPFPVTASAQMLTTNSPHLEYGITTTATKENAEAVLQLYFSPTLNFNNTGLRYAISIDDETPQVINLNGDINGKLWNKWVADNIIIKTTKHTISKPGKHIIKYWMIDPAIVLQKLVLDSGDVRQSYLGPPSLH